MTDGNVLEALDFTPRCSAVGPVAHAAEVGLRCKGCRNVILTCNAHALATATHLLAQGIAAAAAGQIGTVSCSSCGMTRELLHDLVDVVGLDGSVTE